MRFICLFVLLLLCSSVEARECKNVEYDQGDLYICIDEQGKVIADEDLWDNQIEWNWIGYIGYARKIFKTSDGRMFELGLRPDGVVIWQPYKENK